ncbi:unnamed protein product [Moneuplotes crassus]|uniref:Uncharacterized protein n=1 Tax=Euplotes crassus TaxID=5936 RepID=A0AAD1UMS5_EUPCR|nr:unnamed protein product [Moneuplotes crassus]
MPTNIDPRHNMSKDNQNFQKQPNPKRSQQTPAPEDSLAKRRSRRTVKSSSKLNPFVYEIYPNKGSQSFRNNYSPEYQELLLHEIMMTRKTGRNQKNANDPDWSHQHLKKASSHHMGDAGMGMMAKDPDLEAMQKLIKQEIEDKKEEIKEEVSQEEDSDTSSIQDEDRSSGGESHPQKESQKKHINWNFSSRKRKRSRRASNEISKNKPDRRSKNIDNKPSEDKTENKLKKSQNKPQPVREGLRRSTRLHKPIPERPQVSQIREKRSKFNADNPIIRQGAGLHNSRISQPNIIEPFYPPNSQMPHSFPPLNYVVENQRAEYARSENENQPENSQNSYPQFWRYPDGQEIMLSNVELQTNKNQINSDKEPPQRVKNVPRVPNPLASPQKNMEHPNLRINHNTQSGNGPCSLNKFLPEYDLNRSLDESCSESSEEPNETQRYNGPDLKTFANAILKSELLCFFPQSRPKMGSSLESADTDGREETYQCLNLLKIKPF